MPTYSRLALAVAFVLVLLQARAVDLPLELRQSGIPFNLQSRIGPPLITTNEFGDPMVPTGGQFRGLASFGSIGGLAHADWLAVSNSSILRAGTNAFSGVVAQEMRLPLAKQDGQVAIILRQSQVGAPYYSRPTSFAFGSQVSVPETDEYGRLQTAVRKESYWLAEPFTTNSHANSGYYWSPHARAVYAIQPGPILITWRKAQPYTAATRPTYTNLSGTVSYETNGASIRVLYTQRYIISAAACQPPRKIYWTEQEFSDLGKPVAVPSAIVRTIKVVYNRDFPQTVAQQYAGPGYTVPGGTTNQIFPELRTLWYERGNLMAFNCEGRVFVELLGDERADGTYTPIGFEVVDVTKRPVPMDVAIDLGEQVTPPAPGKLEDLYPDPILQVSGEAFAYQYHAPGSDRLQLYATRETENLNDFQVHWMEEGVAGIKWPSLFGRYRFVWPADISRYSHYLRPAARSQSEAQATAVPLNSQNAPVIDYQDALDRPRAQLTEDFKFYTWLDEAHPAHRSLLRFHAGEGEVAFERVFSWLESNLGANHFALNPVVTNLTAWDGTLQSLHWPEDLEGQLFAPRLVRQTVAVGERIDPPSGELGDGNSYWAGYVDPKVGTSYNVKAYADPFESGFEVANKGSIIPINAMPGSNTLQVLWFRTNSANAGPNAGNRAKGFTPIYWPSVAGIYTLQWPQQAPEIVLASNKGSGPLNSFQSTGSIYFQNDPALPGYNPNEEHALMAGGVAFALRDDLNNTNASGYSSHPFVLMDYLAQDGRPAMVAFRVLREKPEAGQVFDYVVEAGHLLQPPMPLPLLEKPVEGQGEKARNYNYEPLYQVGDYPAGWTEAMTNGPYGHYLSFTYRDRNQDFWIYRGPHQGLPVLEAGTYEPSSGKFLPPADATAVVGQPFQYQLHVSREAQSLRLSSDATLPAWLTILGITLQGSPGPSDTGVCQISLILQDAHDSSFWTNRLTVMVVTNGTVVAQGYTQLTCSNRFTGTLVTFEGRPPYLAVSPVPTNSFTMRYYYKNQASFAWPGISRPPGPGTIVPYLLPFDASLNAFVGDATSPETASLDIVYRPVWPAVDPSDSSKPLPALPYGATLTKPQMGLPGVRDMSSAHLLYQQSIALSISSPRMSVVLHDPTREKVADLKSFGLDRLPGGVFTDSYQGKLFFPHLPPHLAGRLSYDPNRGLNGALVFLGVFQEEVLGDSYMLLNVLRGPDLEAVKALCPPNDADYSKWTALVDGLATTVETFYENPDKPGTYIARRDWTTNAGIQEMTLVSSPNTAVDSYALSAVGPGSGYVTLLENGGAAFTQPGQPVAMHIFRVGGGLYSGETKIITAANPLSEQVTMQHSADLAGRFDEYDYEWKMAPPVDGAPPLGDTSMSAYQALTDVQPNLPRYLLGGRASRLFVITMLSCATAPTILPILSTISGPIGPSPPWRKDGSNVSWRE